MCIGSAVWLCLELYRGLCPWSIYSRAWQHGRCRMAPTLTCTNENVVCKKRRNWHVREYIHSYRRKPGAIGTARKGVSCTLSTIWWHCDVHDTPSCHIVHHKVCYRSVVSYNRIPVQVDEIRTILYFIQNILSPSYTKLSYYPFGHWGCHFSGFLQPTYIFHETK